MKTKTFLRSAGLLLALLYFPLPAMQANNPNDSLACWIQPLIETTHIDLDKLERDYSERAKPLRVRLYDVNKTLADPRNRTPECSFQLLLEKIQLEETLDAIQEEHELKLLKVRYRKSIEIVKMLYEKDEL